MAWHGCGQSGRELSQDEIIQTVVGSAVAIGVGLATSPSRKPERRVEPLRRPTAEQVQPLESPKAQSE